MKKYVIKLRFWLRAFDSTVISAATDAEASYDILVQHEDGEVLAETDDLPTYDEAVAAVEKYLLEFPGADVNYGDF